jgi:hypothetical protein
VRESNILPIPHILEMDQTPQQRHWIHSTVLYGQEHLEHFMLLIDIGTRIGNSQISFYSLTLHHVETFRL